MCADVIVNLNVFFLVVGRYDLFIVSNSLIRNSDENSYFGQYCPGNARFDVRNFFALLDIVSPFDGRQSFLLLISSVLRVNNFRVKVIVI